MDQFFKSFSSRFQVVFKSFSSVFQVFFNFFNQGGGAPALRIKNAHREDWEVADGPTSSTKKRVEGSTVTLFFREWIWTLEEKMLSMEGLRGVGGEGQLGGRGANPGGVGVF